MLYFRLRGLSRDGLSQLWIPSRRALEFCIYGTLTHADTVELKSTAKVISGRIAIYPNVILIYLSVLAPKMQDQGLSGYSSAPLTSSAPLRLGKCRLSWVGLGSRCFRLPACLGRGSHSHASSSFVSVQTRTAQR